MSQASGVLFDLDGTLADTAPDLAAAVNALLTHEGRDALPFENIRPWVSWGAPRLIRLAFGDDLPEERFDDLRGRFLAFYEAGLCRHSRVFPSMEPVLQALEGNGHPWGIVTNKPGWLTEPLVAALGLTDRAATVISGDTLPYAKPHPMPLLHAAREMGVAPGRCVYVGDAARDVQAGREAGMVTVAAAWGYIPDDDDPMTWAADHLLDEPSGLVALVATRTDAAKGAA
jgi:phosphoglycolate phosphatase